jgi:hypothetical protein
LAIAAKVYRFCQMALVDVNTKKSNPEANAFKKNMAILFQSFSYNAFAELYKKLVKK